MKYLINSANEIYLDWFNNYLTVGAIADAYGVSDEIMTQILNLGRTINHEGLV